MSNSLWPHRLKHARPLVHHQLLELTHVHQVGDATQPPHPLLSPFSPTFNLSQHHSLFKWVSSSHQVAKVLAFQLQHQVMVGVMAVMGAPSKWLIPANPKAPRLLYSVPLTSGRPLLTHTSPLLEIPGLSWASLGQPLVGSLLLFPGSWCAQGFVCALQVSVSPVLCKFCNQIPLVFKVKFPRGSQCFCQIPPGWGIFVGPRTFATVWELLWYNCSPVWGSSAWWLYSGANGELLQEDLCHTPCLPCLPEPLSPVPSAGRCWPVLPQGLSDTQRQVSFSFLWGLWVLVHPGFCLSPPSISGGYGVWF